MFKSFSAFIDEMNRGNWKWLPVLQLETTFWNKYNCQKYMAKNQILSKLHLNENWENPKIVKFTV